MYGFTVLPNLSFTNVGLFWSVPFDAFGLKSFALPSKDNKLQDLNLAQSQGVAILFHGIRNQFHIDLVHGYKYEYHQFYHKIFTVWWIISNLKPRWVPLKITGTSDLEPERTELIYIFNTPFSFEPTTWYQTSRRKVSEDLILYSVPSSTDTLKCPQSTASLHASLKDAYCDEITWCQPPCSISL